MVGWSGVSGNDFWGFGNGKGIEKTHSRNSGMGRELKKTIPEIREREGNKKIHSRNSGRESEASILGNDREREFPLTPAFSSVNWQFSALRSISCWKGAQNIWFWRRMFVEMHLQQIRQMITDAKWFTSTLFLFEEWNVNSRREKISHSSNWALRKGHMA